MRRPLPLPIVLVAAAWAFAACGGGTTIGAATAVQDPAAERAAVAPVRPALCATLRARRLGEVTMPQAIEISGVTVSRRHPGVLWMVNDSGAQARVLAVTTDGRARADLAVTGAAAVDWEDLGIGPDPDGVGDALYIADIGDNDAVRETVEVYRVPEPDLAAGEGATAPAVRLTLRYPDGPHDAETLLVDPHTGALGLVTKVLSGASRVYVAADPSAERVTTLRSVATVQLGLGGLATGGAVSADGRTVVIRTYDRIAVWRRLVGRSLATTLRGTPCAARVSLAGEGQGEAVALSTDGATAFTVPEGPAPTIRRYRPVSAG